MKMIHFFFIYQAKKFQIQIILTQFLMKIAKIQQSKEQITKIKQFLI